MSYHIYTTRGVVLSSRSLREADRVYSILTRDLGLIRATALGVRKEESKLRGHIEPLSLSTISLVRGKEYWRLTSADSIKNIPVSPNFSKPFSLIETLVQGEDPNQELFDAVEEEIISNNETDEVKLVSRILFYLGYLQEEDLKLEKEELIKAINKGLESSHLT